MTGLDLMKRIDDLGGRTREGDVPADMQGMAQELWDQAYRKIKTFIEQDNASGKASIIGF